MCVCSFKGLPTKSIENCETTIGQSQVNKCLAAGEGDGQTEQSPTGFPRDIKGYQDRKGKGSALGATAPQKKMTSSLPTSSVVVGGVVGSEGAGEAGGSVVPPDLKASGAVAAGAGLGAGKQGSGRELRVVTGVLEATANSGQPQWPVAGLTWGRRRSVGCR